MAAFKFTLFHWTYIKNYWDKVVDQNITTLSENNSFSKKPPCDTIIDDNKPLMKGIKMQSEILM
jgi:hypothetical protein